MKPVNAVLVMRGERRGTVLEQIEACGVHVQVAGRLEEARGILSTRPVELIFTDTVLPDGDWRDVIAERGTAAPCAEVIVCTKWLDGKLCAEAFTRGAWDVIAETSSREELRRAIESAVSRSYMQSLGRAGRPAVARAAS